MCLREQVCMLAYILCIVDPTPLHINHPKRYFSKFYKKKYLTKISSNNHFVLIPQHNYSLLLKRNLDIALGMSSLLYVRCKKMIFSPQGYNSCLNVRFFFCYSVSKQSAMSSYHLKNYWPCLIILFVFSVVNNIFCLPFSCLLFNFCYFVSIDLRWR